MARPVFVPNHRFASQLLVTPQIRDLLESFWPELEDAAVSRARELSGELRDGIHYDVDITPAGFAGRLNSDDWKDRKSTRLNSSHIQKSRMPSSA